MPFIFNKCCCCVDLRLGCLIFGYVTVVLTILSAIITVATFEETYKKHESDKGKTIAIALACCSIFVHILCVIFCLLLVIGIHTRKRGYIKAFLIYSAVCIVVAIILFIASIIYGAHAFSIIRDIVIIVLFIYFFLVVRSFYNKMDEYPATSTRATQQEQS